MRFPCVSQSSVVDENDDSIAERKGSTVNEHHHECNFGLVQVAFSNCKSLTSNNRADTTKSGEKQIEEILAADKFSVLNNCQRCFEQRKLCVLCQQRPFELELKCCVLHPLCQLSCMSWWWKNEWIDFGEALSPCLCKSAMDIQDGKGLRFYGGRDGLR